MVQLRTVKPPKENWGDEQLDDAAEDATNGEAVTDLGSLGLKVGQRDARKYSKLDTYVKA